LDDWYNVNRRDVERSGGIGLLAQYPSLEKAVQTLYPEHSWKDSKFRPDREIRPKGFWKDKKNLLEILSKAEERLGIAKVRAQKNIATSIITKASFISLKTGILFL